MIGSSSLNSSMWGSSASQSVLQRPEQLIALQLTDFGDCLKRVQEKEQRIKDTTHTMSALGNSG